MDSINQNVIFNTINNGILILDEEFNILAWNDWLEIHTGIKKEDIINKNIFEKFDYINKSKLKRKIKTSLITNNPVFFNSSPQRYLIEIKLNGIMNKIYDYMQQDITIVPYNADKKQVCIYIYDNTKIYEMNSKLENANAELKELSNIDPMTGCYNRRYFSNVSSNILKLAKRNEEKVSIIILDIDKFKRINDTYGHNVGDDVIKLLANTLKISVRKSDIVARFGGEEFVILLPHSNETDAKNCADKLREKVEALEIPLENETLKFTISLGVAEYKDDLDDFDLEHTISRADKALYDAKTSGRNRVCVYMLES